MNTEPAFLSLAQVETLHRVALEQHGGQDGVRDASALESAVMHPRNVWLYSQGDLFDIAAAYAFHLAESQAFLDGNKRVGAGAALTFLEGNGVSVPEATDQLHAAMIAISARQMDKASFATLLRRLAASKEKTTPGRTPIRIR